MRMVAIRPCRCGKSRLTKLFCLFFTCACVFALTVLHDSSVLNKTREGLEQYHLDPPVSINADADFFPWDSSLNETWAQPPAELCPVITNVPAYNVTLKLADITYEELEEKFGKFMRDGGHYVPRACRSVDHLAVIIPYRDRQRNLNILLHNLLPFLWRQQVEFTVFLVEQTPGYNFNKGLMFNVAFLESQKKANITCFIMQDVDLVPMDHRNFYRCNVQPRHLVLTVGQANWSRKLTYPTAFGGAVALRKTHIKKTNGFSVSYYGWGLEDDDLAIRLRKKGFRLLRYPVMVGKYYKLDHARQAPNSQWKNLKKTITERLKKGDGLNSMKYTLLVREEKRLFTRLLVQPPPPPVSIYGVVTPDYSSQTTKNKNSTKY